MPPAAWALLQSTQFTEVAGRIGLAWTAPTRQLPAAKNAHHAGSAAEAEPRSIVISSPVTPGVSEASSYDATSWSAPVFVSHAKFRYCTPPSPKHWSQRRFTPGGLVPAYAGR